MILGAVAGQKEKRPKRWAEKKQHLTASASKKTASATTNDLALMYVIETNSIIPNFYAELDDCVSLTMEPSGDFSILVTFALQHCCYRHRCPSKQ